MSARRRAQRRGAPLVLSALLLTACSTASSTPAQRGPQASPVVTPGFGQSPSGPTLVRPPAAVRGVYEQRLLTSGAVAVWPLSSATNGGTSGLGPSGAVASLTGPVPATVSGPTLLGTKRTALAFRGASRFTTGLTTGLADTEAWSVEAWVRSDGCAASGYERLASTRSITSEGRQGLDVFHYPRTAARHAACGYGVEYYSDGTFQGGCAVHQLAGATWNHLAFTYRPGVDGEPGLVLCYLDGALAGRGRIRSTGHGVSAPLVIGGTDDAYDKGLTGSSLAELAVYDEVLSPAVVRAHALAVRVS